MLHWIGLSLLAIALFLVARWMLAGRFGTRGVFPIKSVIALVAIGALAMAPWILRMQLELRLAEAVSAVAGREVAIQCQSFAAAFIDPTSELGHVSFDTEQRTEPKALIKRDQCRALASYLSSDKQNPTRDQIVAVHVLTHEAMHMAGVTSEPDAECLALGADARMARLLGASAEAADALAAEYRRDVYPDMPADYQKEDCEAAAS